MPLRTKRKQVSRRAFLYFSNKRLKPPHLLRKKKDQSIPQASPSCFSWPQLHFNQKKWAPNLHLSLSFFRPVGIDFASPPLPIRTSSTHPSLSFSRSLLPLSKPSSAHTSHKTPNTFLPTPQTYSPSLPSSTAQTEHHTHTQIRARRTKVRKNREERKNQESLDQDISQFSKKKPPRLMMP